MFKWVRIVMAAVILTLPVATEAAADMKSWQKSLVKKIRKKQVYPRSAFAKEIEGKAKVRSIIAADGQITGHEIVQATGEAVLDREIPKLVKRLNPLKALPDGRTELRIVIPLNWQLD